jgi:hypothetical protein
MRTELERLWAEKGTILIRTCERSSLEKPAIKNSIGSQTFQGEIRDGQEEQD